MPAPPWPPVTSWPRLAAWQRAAAIPAQYSENEDSPQKMIFDLRGPASIRVSSSQRAGPAASPYQLKPSDIPTGDSLPSLGGSPSAPPVVAEAQNVSPYSLPAESNPLQRRAPQRACMLRRRRPSMPLPSPPLSRLAPRTKNPAACRLATRRRRVKHFACWPRPAWLWTVAMSERLR